jgi:hypothetical protein
VAGRFIARGYDWDTLAAGVMSGVYDPAWFRAALAYSSGERNLQDGFVLLVEATRLESAEARGASHYIWDGLHRTLVAAVEHLCGTRTYEPLAFISTRPRPPGK